MQAMRALLLLFLIHGTARGFSPLPCASRRRNPVPALRSSFSADDAIGSGSALALRGALARLEDRRRADPPPSDGHEWEKVGAAWALVPPGRVWGAIHFVGGAGIGQFPQVCYDRLLRLVSTTPGLGGGIVVIATPYETGLDHGSLAEYVDAAFDDALRTICEQKDWSDPSRLARLRLGHSLGGKLLLLRRTRDLQRMLSSEGPAAEAGGAGGSSSPEESLAVMGFNNAPLTESLKLLERLVTAYGGGPAGAASQPVAGAVLSAIGMAATAAGFEFRPSAEEMEEQTVAALALLAERDGPEATLPWLPLFLSMEDDDLDTSQRIVQGLPAPVQKVVEDGERCKLGLKGNHLTPAFLSLGTKDLQDAARKAAVEDGVGPSVVDAIFGDGGGAEAFKISFGDEDAVQALADEIVSWVLREARGPPAKELLLPPAA